MTGWSTRGRAASRSIGLSRARGFATESSGTGIAEMFGSGDPTSELGDDARTVHLLVKDRTRGGDGILLRDLSTMLGWEASRLVDAVEQAQDAGVVLATRQDAGSGIKLTSTSD